MINPMRPATESRLLRLLDLGERSISLLLFAGFAVRVIRGMELHPQNILALISEALVVLFILFRRYSETVTTRPQDWIAALMGTMLPLLVRPGGVALVPPDLAAALMFAGLGLAIWAKLALRRSFGLAAANRGVVQAGPYRFVRHPMYAGYVLVHLGFLLLNPLALNAVLYAATLGCQIWRILAEERVLAGDPQYAALMRQARFRLIPWVF